MNTRQLKYAVALAKNPNFSAVAESLGITQPALSKQISHLEQELGVKLFDRSTNPLQLTSAGEYFLREAETLLYREDQLLRSMEEFQSGKRGRLTIGISPFRCLYLIPPIAKALREKFPETELVLQEEGSDLLRKDAADGKFDFAIVNLPVDESTLEVTPIQSDTLVLAVPQKMAEEYGLSEGNKFDPAKAGALPFIAVGKGQEMRMLFDKICRNADLQPTVAMEVVGLASAWAMVRAGVGATLLPLQFIEQMGKVDEIALFPLERSVRSRQPAIVYRKGQYLSEPAKYAIELLQREG
jgi:DNA-binding transcriptional LysR family regulator